MDRRQAEQIFHWTIDQQIGDRRVKLGRNIAFVHNMFGYPAWRLETHSICFCFCIGGLGKPCFAAFFRFMAVYLETDLVLVQGSYKRFADSLGAFSYSKLIKESLSKFCSMQDENNEVMSFFKPKHPI
jgi:hypothetical protein